MIVSFPTLFQCKRTMAEPTNVLSPPRPNDSMRGWDMPVSSRPDTDRTQIFVTDPNGTEEELVRSQKVIAELSELVTNSTELAEAQEQQLYDAQTTNDELTADISSMRSQSVRMETRIDTLTKQLERDARMQEESIEEWRTRCAALERRLTTAQTEKDNANFVADELRADIYSGQRAAEASVALAKSQAGEERSKARSEMDALVNKLLACERALEEKGTVSRAADPVSKRFTKTKRNPCTITSAEKASWKSTLRCSWTARTF